MQSLGSRWPIAALGFGSESLSRPGASHSKHRVNGFWGLDVQLGFRLQAWHPDSGAGP